MEKTAVSTPYLSSLQAFRGIAALAVVFYHAGLFVQRRWHVPFCGDAFRHGDIGVDFFFVLSGFIIAFVHWDDLGKAEAAPRYLWRRFFRIYPLLFLLTSLRLLAGFVMPGDGSRAGGEVILSSYLLLPLFDGVMPVITAAWTLTHEVLFYALFLVAILAGRTVGAALLSLWAVGLVALHLGGVALHDVSAFAFDPHNIEFLLGIGACLWFRRGIPAGLAWLLIPVAMGLVVCGAVLTVPEAGKDQAFPVRLVLGLAFASLIAGVTSLEARRIWKSVPRWLSWLGDASYSIYLGHSFLLITLLAVLNRWGAKSAARAHGVTFVALAVTLLCCGLLWWLVERPLLRWSKRWTR